MRLQVLLDENRLRCAEQGLVIRPLIFQKSVETSTSLVLAASPASSSSPAATISDGSSVKERYSSSKTLSANAGLPSGCAIDRAGLKHCHCSGH